MRTTNGRHTLAPLLFETPKGQRFTQDGSDDLETRLDAICQTARREVCAIVPEKRLEGLVLGGSYGRGEGGVFRTELGDLPYNDLEFFVFVNGPCRLNERRYSSALHELGLHLTRAAQVDVEFKILSLNKLRRSRITMSFHDLVSGHRRLWGEGDLFNDCRHHLESVRIPRDEAVRLLFNRCSGLLFSAARLRKGQLSEEDRRFIVRNHAKARLGMGDAVLTVLGHYHSSCRERGNRFQKLRPVEGCDWFEAVRCHHQEGVAFKLHPSETPDAGFEVMQRELTDLGLKIWLWIESHRLGHKFVSALDYAKSAVNKCNEHPWSRNLLINALVLRTLSKPFRYPRARLFNALALLLWEPNAVGDPDCVFQLQRELRTQGTSFAEFVEAYEQLWHRFN